MNNPARREGSQRLLSSYRSRSINPNLQYAGIHNHDIFRMRMTIDGSSSQSRQTRPSTTQRPSKRYSVPDAHSPHRPLVLSSTPVNKYASIEQYYNPSDIAYSYFPSRHKYVKGKKRPVAVNILDFQGEQDLSNRLRQELRKREQKKKHQTNLKFQQIKQKYIQLSKSRKSVPVRKPQKAVKSKTLNPQINLVLNISPWDNEDDFYGF